MDMSEKEIPALELVAGGPALKNTQAIFEKTVGGTLTVTDKLLGRLSKLGIEPKGEFEKNFLKVLDAGFKAIELGGKAIGGFFILFAVLRKMEIADIRDYIKRNFADIYKNLEALDHTHLSPTEFIKTYQEFFEKDRYFFEAAKPLILALLLGPDYKEYVDENNKDYTIEFLMDAMFFADNVLMASVKQKDAYIKLRTKAFLYNARAINPTITEAECEKVVAEWIDYQLGIIVTPTLTDSFFNAKLAGIEKDIILSDTFRIDLDKQKIANKVLNYAKTSIADKREFEASNELADRQIKIKSEELESFFRDINNINIGKLHKSEIYDALNVLINNSKLNPPLQNAPTSAEYKIMQIFNDDYNLLKYFLFEMPAGELEIRVKELAKVIGIQEVLGGQDLEIITKGYFSLQAGLPATININDTNRQKISNTQNHRLQDDQHFFVSFACALYDRHPKLVPFDFASPLDRANLEHIEVFNLMKSFSSERYFSEEELYFRSLLRTFTRLKLISGYNFTENLSELNEIPKDSEKYQVLQVLTFLANAYKTNGYTYFIDNISKFNAVKLALQYFQNQLLLNKANKRISQINTQLVNATGNNQVLIEEQNALINSKNALDATQVQIEMTLMSNTNNAYLNAQDFIDGVFINTPNPALLDYDDTKGKTPAQYASNIISNYSDTNGDKKTPDYKKAINAKEKEVVAQTRIFVEGDVIDDSKVGFPEIYSFLGLPIFATTDQMQTALDQLRKDNGVIDKEVIGDKAQLAKITEVTSKLDSSITRRILNSDFLSFVVGNPQTRQLIDDLKKGKLDDPLVGGQPYIMNYVLAFLNKVPGLSSVFPDGFYNLARGFSNIIAELLKSLTPKEFEDFLNGRIGDKNFTNEQLRLLFMYLTDPEVEGKIKELSLLCRQVQSLIDNPELKKIYDQQLLEAEAKYLNTIDKSVDPLSHRIKKALAQAKVPVSQILPDEEIPHDANRFFNFLEARDTAIQFFSASENDYFQANSAELVEDPELTSLLKDSHFLATVNSETIAEFKSKGVVDLIYIFNRLKHNGIVKDINELEILMTNYKDDFIAFAGFELGRTIRNSDIENYEYLVDSLIPANDFLSAIFTTDFTDPNNSFVVYSILTRDFVGGMSLDALPPQVKHTNIVSFKQSTEAKLEVIQQFETDIRFNGNLQSVIQELMKFIKNPAPPTFDLSEFLEVISNGGFVDALTIAQGYDFQGKSVLKHIDDIIQVIMPSLGTDDKFELERFILEDVFPFLNFISEGYEYTTILAPDYINDLRNIAGQSFALDSLEVFYILENDWNAHYQDLLDNRQKVEEIYNEAKTSLISDIPNAIANTKDLPKVTNVNKPTDAEVNALMSRMKRDRSRAFRPLSVQSVVKANKESKTLRNSTGRIAA